MLKLPQPHYRLFVDRAVCTYQQPASGLHQSQPASRFSDLNRYMKLETACSLAGCWNNNIACMVAKQQNGVNVTGFCILRCGRFRLARRHRTLDGRILREDKMLYVGSSVNTFILWIMTTRTRRVFVRSNDHSNRQCRTTICNLHINSPTLTDPVSN
jgi:hypothetical protein